MSIFKPVGFFIKGAKVIALKEIRTCLNGGSIVVQEGETGTVISAWANHSVTVSFENHFDSSRSRYGHPVSVYISDSHFSRYASDYPSLSSIKLLEPSSLEGTTFQIIEDQGDGKYLVQREDK